MDSFFISALDGRTCFHLVCEVCYPLATDINSAQQIVTPTVLPQLQEGKAAREADTAAQLHRGSAEELSGPRPGYHACGAQFDHRPQQGAQRPL